MAAEKRKATYSHTNPGWQTEGQENQTNRIRGRGGGTSLEVFPQAFDSSKQDILRYFDHSIAVFFQT